MTSINVFHAQSACGSHTRWRIRGLQSSHMRFMFPVIWKWISECGSSFFMWFLALGCASRHTSKCLKNEHFENRASLYFNFKLVQSGPEAKISFSFPKWDFWFLRKTWTDHQTDRLTRFMFYKY